MKTIFPLYAVTGVLFMLYSLASGSFQKSSGNGDDWEMKVVVQSDTVLIYDPATGKEEIKVVETRDTVMVMPVNGKKPD